MIGIYDLNTCSKLDYKTRLNIYKEAGFREVALYLDSAYMTEGETYEDIIAYARAIGLEVKQVHLDYKISNLICDETTNEYFDYISQKTKEAASLNIPFIVAHASMTAEPPLINDKQLNKFADMMNSLKDLPVVLCLENVRNNHNLREILKLKLDNVAMCYDIGHAHCYGDEQEIFEEFASDINVSHLHNNTGKDTHNLLNEGEMDVSPIIKELVKIPHGSHCLECFPPFGVELTEAEFVDFVKKCYDSIAIF